MRMSTSFVALLGVCVLLTSCADEPLPRTVPAGMEDQNPTLWAVDAGPTFDISDPGDPALPVCGDGQCSPGESSGTCPGDCGSLCGDGVCAADESEVTCAMDCGATCGDGGCEADESSFNCPVDCGSQCGDGACNGGESTTNCAQDCGSICGDGICNGIEVTANCSEDCGATCGDGACNGTESSVNCVDDCGASCGDGVCNGGESPGGCSADCGSPPPLATDLNGYVDGVMDYQGGKVVQGWACQLQWGGSIAVDLYLGGPAGEGIFLKTEMADEENEAAVGAACQTDEGSHRYRIPLTPGELAEYAGEAIYVYGISPDGDSSFLLTKSGEHHMPGGGGSGGGATGDDVTAPDLSTVTWLHTDVSGWPVTANLSSVTVEGNTICLNYDKANTWPSVSIPHSSGNGNVDVVANPWVLAQYNGQWYAGTWEWLAVGTTCRNKAAVAGDHIKQPPFGPANWKPTSGETLFFMVSGLARFPTITNVSERSNLVKVVWP